MATPYQHLNEAIANHYSRAKADAENRTMVCIRVEDMAKPKVPSITRLCGTCNEPVWLDKDFEDTLNKCVGLTCSRCLEKETGKSMKEIVLEQLNYDNEEEV